ncbi:MAG: phosphatase PAP2 family protein [Bacteroidetes bacterium]|nr:phosphatase PAP2 family protein [Bacteroidota bacterium]
MLEFLNQLDTQAFLLVNGWNHPLIDPFMVFVSGKISWLPLYLVLLYFIIRQYRWQSVMVLLIIGLMITASDQLSVRAFKYVFERPRPCHENDLLPLIHLVNGKCGGAYGFVSSHAANAFALAGFIILMFRNRHRFIGPIMFAYAFLVAYSRVYLGVHYPGDVIVGGMLGIVVAITAFRVFRLAEEKWCKKSC